MYIYVSVFGLVWVCACSRERGEDRASERKVSLNRVSTAAVVMIFLSSVSHLDASTTSTAHVAVTSNVAYANSYLFTYTAPITHSKTDTTYIYIYIYTQINIYICENSKSPWGIGRNRISIHQFELFCSSAVNFKAIG